MFTACTAKCVLDKLVAELRPGSRNTIAMSTYQLEKSSVTEHSFDLIHQLVLNKASIMLTNSSTMDQLIKEWINTELHLTSMNQDDGFYLSRLWRPLIHSPEERIQPAFSRNVITSPSWGYKSPTSILMPTVQSQLLPMQVLITRSAAKEQTVIRLQSLSTWFQHSIAEPPDTSQK